MNRARILGLAGSLRQESHNKALLVAAAKLAPPGVRVEIYEDLARVPLFSEDVEAEGVPDGVRRLARAVAACDGLLLATPEYNQSIPGVLKNAIDWLSRPSVATPLDGMPAATMGITSGQWGTRYAQAALRHVLLATGALVLPASGAYFRDAPTLIDRGTLRDEHARASVARLLADFADWIDRCAGQPRSSVAMK